MAKELGDLTDSELLMLYIDITDLQRAIDDITMIDLKVQIEYALGDIDDEQINRNERKDKSS